MSRVARIIMPEVPHHVTQRGNRRQRTFFSSADYEAYLDFLATNAKTFGYDVWSYVLMPNHVHLLVVPRSAASLQDGIAQTHGAYTRLINRAHGWKGHLWQGRFYSCPIDPARAAMVAQYIELNPVRAGLCDTPRRYRWSSAAYACDGVADPRFGMSPVALQIGDWENFLVSVGPDRDHLDRLRRTSTSGRPFGDAAFIASLEKSLGRALTPLKRGPRVRSVEGP